MASWAEREMAVVLNEYINDMGTKGAVTRAIRETIEEAARRAKERGNCPHCARRILALLNDDGADRG